MVHLSFVEWVGLLPGASIAVPILSFWAVIGIMSILPALVTGDVAEILLGGCGRGRTILIIVFSIPIPILGAIVVVRTSSSMGVSSMVMGVSSQIRSESGLQLGSRIIPSLSILPLATLNLLLLPFNHKSFIYQLLVVVEGCHHQLYAHLII